MRFNFFLLQIYLKKHMWIVLALYSTRKFDSELEIYELQPEDADTNEELDVEIDEIIARYLVNVPIFSV